MLRRLLWLICLLLPGLAALTDKKVDVTPTRFDSGLSDIQWLRQDHSVVMVLTTRGHVWRSPNSGRTFQDITYTVDKTLDKSEAESVTTPNNTVARGPPVRPERFFEFIKVHPTNKNYAVLLTKGDQTYLTMNAGITWYPLGRRTFVHNWVWHPLRPTHALMSEWTAGCRGRRPGPTIGDCNHQLYITTNGGRTVSKVADFVIQYNWGDKSLKEQADAIFMTQHTRVRKHQPRWGGWHANTEFVKLTNWGTKRHVLVPGGNKFLVAKDFVFVATVDDYLRQTVSLMVSSDGGRSFNKAQIPSSKMMEKSYTILDTSGGNVLIHVNHGSTSPGILEGNVYVSDSTGTKFSLSLPNNIRAATGECEFDKVVGVEGVYIANTRSDSVLEGGDGEEDLRRAGEEDEEGSMGMMKAASSRRQTSPVVRTVISFDKGGSWQYLKPPTKDTLGNRISCEDSQKCWLHLHGITHFDRFAPFYSSENALGLVMGTGNVGAHLSRDAADINTYISRDAGRTWAEAHKGSYIYEFGDHGGLVVMAHDNKKTGQVVFSWNEGQSWYDFTLGMNDVAVDNVIIEPTSTGLEFLVYGTIGEKGVLFHTDFGTLNQRQCIGMTRPDNPSKLDLSSAVAAGTVAGTVAAPVGAEGVVNAENSGPGLDQLSGGGSPAGGSDYEYWYTSQEEQNSRCMLGRRVKYVRKKPYRECFNGKDFVRLKDKHTCECSRENYMCETGFFRPVNHETDAECEPSPYEDREYMAIEGCTSSGVYYTHAWRKVPGDECKGGWAPEKVPMPCPPGSPMAAPARATLWTVVLSAVALGALSWASKHPLLRPYVQRAGLDQFVEVGYSVVGKAGESMQRGGEELFNFWTGKPEDENVTTTAALTLSNPPASHAAGIELNTTRLDII
ncbi:putative sortilin [Gregarina niphandrodes]|uniref:Sortilin n=1 Tax=Gregarina niphandrodes TaxID=110365 RepID=A0A023B441_GRENI|nr:putative sortilin [Gregarina niphandrodes]EZG56353.1 putative sortilin [Gregarina niphandrodes]|eukprot:XP_011131282.1 putative sortilin [Gregarina niphandrodes]